MSLTAGPQNAGPPDHAALSTAGIVSRRRVMFMSEAWVLIAITPVLYLLSMNGHKGLRFLMLAFVFLVIGDGLLSYVLTRSIRISAQLPTTIDLGTSIEIPVAVGWPIGGPVIAHFTGGLASGKAGGRACTDGSLWSTGSSRGEKTEVTLTLAAGAFLGLIGFVTESTLTPDRPMLVLPPTTPHPEVTAYLRSITTANEPDLIGVRPYRPGDRPADVHWPSVARTNEVMVRERAAMPFEPPPLTVVATGRRQAELDATLAVARFAVEQAWRSGVAVTLVTHEHVAPPMAPEPPGRFTIPYLPPSDRPNPVLTHRELAGPGDLHRALARAIPGPDPEPSVDGASINVGALIGKLA